MATPPTKTPFSVSPALNVAIYLYHLPHSEQYTPQESFFRRIMAAYVSFIHRENASFGVSFPDFPGCVTVGNTLEDAVRQGREVLALHIELLAEDGISIPSPRSIEVIKADPKLKDWRDGADLVLIPLISST